MLPATMITLQSLSARASSLPRSENIYYQRDPELAMTIADIDIWRAADLGRCGCPLSPLAAEKAVGPLSANFGVSGGGGTADVACIVTDCRTLRWAVICRGC